MEDNEKQTVCPVHGPTELIELYYATQLNAGFECSCGCVVHFRHEKEDHWQHYDATQKK